MSIDSDLIITGTFIYALVGFLRVYTKLGSSGSPVIWIDERRLGFQ